MKANDPDSPVRRMTLAIVAAFAVMLVAGLLYVQRTSNGPETKVNGAVIIAAAHEYAVDLRAKSQPIPNTVSLQNLASLGYLKPEQIAVFKGLEATLYLTADASNPQAVLMRVHMADGTDLLLLNDGSTQEQAHTH